MQKESFWSAKRVLLERKRSPFRMQKDSFWNAAIEKRRFCTCFSYSATHFRLPSKSHFGKRLALLLGMSIELSQMGKQRRCEHAMLKERRCNRSIQREHRHCHSDARSALYNPFRFIYYSIYFFTLVATTK